MDGEEITFELGVEDVTDSMNAGNSFVNVHTKQNPGGEIRGQIEQG